MFSLIHVHDLARFITYIANDPETVNKSFEPDDGKKEGYLWIDMIRETARILHQKHLSVLRDPSLAAEKLCCLCSHDARG